MARPCDFCKFTNQYICDPEDHCGQCLQGQKALSKGGPKRPLKWEEATHGREIY